MYPPRVFQEHMEIVTNWVIDEGVKMMPGNKSIKEILRPFWVMKELTVKNGVVPFEDDYRNMIGIATRVNKDLNGDCKCNEDEHFENDPLEDSEVAVMKKIQKAKCISRPVTIVEQEEFDRLSTHRYKRPTYEAPVACVLKGVEIKICPFDLSHVDVRYIRKPKQYVYGYRELPDHTFVFDKNTSTESEWEDTAMQYLLKGLNTLYSAYVKDAEMYNWNELIKKVGLF